MKAVDTNFKVESILFESNDPEVVLRGTTVKGVMHYESELILNQTQLNMVLNSLQRQNSSVTVNDYIISEPMYDGEMMFTGDFAELPNVLINLDTISTTIPMKQIRA